MSKELEVLEKVKRTIKAELAELDLMGFEQGDKYNYLEQLLNELTVVESALQRLESIDNSNPSEALKNFESMKGQILQVDDDFEFYADKVEQALLKAQEPKQYLKWEDLDFTKDFKCQKVKMNDNDYRIRYTLDDFGGKCCFLYDSARNHYIVLNKQFFNDLHLERVEE